MATVTGEPAAAGRRTGVVAVLLATTIAQVASVMGIAVFPVIAPRLASEIGVAAAMIGFQISLIYGAATVGSPLMSFAATRWGACRTMQGGLACSVAAMALSLTGSLPALALASVLLGLSMTMITPAASHLLFSYTHARHRNLIFSIKQTGVPLAWVIMALIAPSITLAFGWRWAVAAVLAVALITALALQRARERWDDDRKHDAPIRANPLTALAALWHYPVLRWLAIASCALSFVQLCLGTFLVTMLVNETAYGLVTAGVMLSMVQAAGVGGRVVWGWIADRTRNSLGLLKMLAAITTVCCIAIAFLTPAWPKSLLAVFLVVFGSAAVGWNGLFMAEVARWSPRGMVSVATSAAMTWNFGGILVGPALFALVFEATGRYTVSFGLVAIVGVCGFAALSMCHAAARREQAAA